MATRSLVDLLGSLEISSSEHLIFEPNRNKSELLEKADDIPRYLFRVFTPKATGITDVTWTKSKDARHEIPTSRLDVFANGDNKAVAAMLNRHLRWFEGDDNFVSWTSSLLFALVYVFYLHANQRDGSDFSEIQICIIDTTRIAKGVFLRDLDLIRAYSAFDKDLASILNLRTKSNKRPFYFGEYLSQGALKIEGKCAIIPASLLIDRGLYDLQPIFKEYSQWPRAIKIPWAYAVLDLRNAIDQKTTEPSTSTILRAITRIMQLFDPPWRLTMAVNLIASFSCRMEDPTILEFFGGDSFTGSFLVITIQRLLIRVDDDRSEACPAKTTIMAYDALIEVRQVQELMRNIYTDFCLKKMTEYTAKAEIELRSFVLWRAHLSKTATAELNQIAASRWSAVSRRLSNLKTLCELHLA